MSSWRPLGLWQAFDLWRPPSSYWFLVDPPGPRRLATIVHDRAVVRRLLNSDSLPDILRGRLVYDLQEIGESLAQKATVLWIRRPRRRKRLCYGLGCLLDTDGMRTHRYAVLAIAFEHFLCQNWQNFPFHPLGNILEVPRGTLLDLAPPPSRNSKYATVRMVSCRTEPCGTVSFQALATVMPSMRNACKYTIAVVWPVHVLDACKIAIIAPTCANQMSEEHESDAVGVVYFTT